MKELFENVFGLSMLVFVSGSMVTLGLGLTIPQIIEPFKNTRMVVLSLMANFALVPLFAFGLVWLFPVSEGVRIGILLLAFGGGAPFITKIVETAKGRVASAIGLMLLLLIATILLMPLVVPVVFSGTTVNSAAIAKPLFLIMLLPLGLALFVNARFPNIAARIQPFAEKLTTVSILSLLIAVTFLYTKVVILSATSLPIVLIFFLGSMAIGYFAAGKDRDARITLSVGTGMRNPSVAILVASNNFPNEPMAAIIPLLVIIVGLAILFPWARKIAARERANLQVPPSAPL